jgi:ATP adenylyltransferase
LEYLWSPWRMNYIQSNKEKNGCVFCLAADMPDSPENLIVFRGKQSYVILNRYPYTSGHLMVVPYVHQATILELDEATRAEMMELTNQCVRVLQAVYSPHGFNVGINIGSAAGAGIREHIHMHVVPRWDGDTNFMASLGDTRVLPETLEDSYWRIDRMWKTLTTQ